jgi:hypothetical protein
VLNQLPAANPSCGIFCLFPVSDNYFYLLHVYFDMHLSVSEHKVNHKLCFRKPDVWMRGDRDFLWKEKALARKQGWNIAEEAKACLRLQDRNVTSS